MLISLHIKYSEYLKSLFFIIQLHHYINKSSVIVAVNSHSTVSAYTFAIDIFNFETAGCFPLICVLQIHHDKQVYSLNFVLRNLD